MWCILLSEKLFFFGGDLKHSNSREYGVLLLLFLQPHLSRCNERRRRKKRDFQIKKSKKNLTPLRRRRRRKKDGDLLLL
jgi:hypothetical protein